MAKHRKILKYIKYVKRISSAVFYWNIKYFRVILLLILLHFFHQQIFTFKTVKNVKVACFIGAGGLILENLIKSKLNTHYRQQILWNRYILVVCIEIRRHRWSYHNANKNYWNYSFYGHFLELFGYPTLSYCLILILFLNNCINNSGSFFANNAFWYLNTCRITLVCFFFRMRRRLRCHFLVFLALSGLGG